MVGTCSGIYLSRNPEIQSPNQKMGIEKTRNLENEIELSLSHPARKRENGKTRKRAAGQPPRQKTRKRENGILIFSFSRFLVFWIYDATGSRFLIFSFSRFLAGWLTGRPFYRFPVFSFSGWVLQRTVDFPVERTQEAMVYAGITLQGQPTLHIMRCKAAMETTTQNLTIHAL